MVFIQRFGDMRYATSYEKKIKSLLKEPTGISVTTFPITQCREPEKYDWKIGMEILTLNQSKILQNQFFLLILLYISGKVTSN